MNTSSLKRLFTPARQGCGVLLALMLLPTALSSIAAPPRTGEAFPSLNGLGLEGAIPELKGNVALVDFWASWCVPCKHSFPVMKEIQDKFGPRGFVVVAVSVDETKSAMEAFLKKNSVPFIILRDAKGTLAEKVGVEKMPTSFLVGADGKLLAVHSGFEGESTRKQYLAEVEAALKISGK